MIAGTTGRRGQPLIMLALVLTCWIGGRLLTWESPFIFPVAAFESLSSAYPSEREPTDRSPEPFGSGALPSAWAAAPVRLAPMTGPADPVAHLDNRRAGMDADAPRPVRRTSGAVMAGHQLLWLAAMGGLPVPGDVAQALHRATVPQPPWMGSIPDSPANGGAVASRWRFDSWLLLRPGGTGVVGGGTGSSSYGASQAGAVVRYRLDPDSGHRPAAYLRATQAFAVGNERELSAGLAARPVPSIPVAVHSEVRLTQADGGGGSVRPAAFAVTDLPPVNLGNRVEARGYAAAGYVGGDFATTFVDGQARVDRELARFDLGTVHAGTIHAGAGAWGGAQQGAARLDVGPAARFEIAIGETSARLAIDYRVRVAGQSAPGSGIAVTLAAGF